MKVTDLKTATMWDAMRRSVEGERQKLLDMVWDENTKVVVTVMSNGRTIVEEYIKLESSAKDIIALLVKRRNEEVGVIKDQLASVGVEVDESKGTDDEPTAEAGPTDDPSASIIPIR